MEKNTFKRVMRMMVVALVAMVAMGFASCSNDDDSTMSPIENPNKGDDKAMLRLYVTGTETYLKIFDVKVSWYDEAGTLQSETLKPNVVIDKLVKYPSQASHIGYSVTISPRSDFQLEFKKYTNCQISYGASENDFTKLQYKSDGNMKSEISQYGVERGTTVNIKDQATFDKYVALQVKHSKNCLKKLSSNGYVNM